MQIQQEIQRRYKIKESKKDYATAMLELLLFGVLLLGLLVSLKTEISFLYFRVLQFLTEFLTQYRRKEINDVFLDTIWDWINRRKQLTSGCVGMFVDSFVSW